MDTSICLKYALVTGLSVGGTLQAFSQDMPNVVFILADDLGYSDIGCYGAEKIKTPAIDGLACQGVRFTNAYSPASTSSPSRYALLTGEYAWRSGVSIMPADAPLAIDTASLTLPKVMKRLGYRTGIVGKWHLGLGSKSNPVDFNREIQGSPEDLGFDYAYYFPATNDRVPCIYIENRRVVGYDVDDPIEISYRAKVEHEPTGAENPELLTMKYHYGHTGTIVNGVSRIGWMSGGKSAWWNDETMSADLLDKAIEFIEEKGPEPFFLYYATHNAHEPRIPSARYRGKSQAGIYGDVIEEFDGCVAGIVEALKARGIFENTIIIVTSDNAPMIKEGYEDGALENINGHNPYGIFRGEKYSLHEGGCRVPFIFSFPKRVKEPFVQEQPFCYQDMLTTLPTLLGVGDTPDKLVDAVNGSELFVRRDAKPYRPYIVTQNNENEVSLRYGKWKYIHHEKWGRSQLFNLENDPSELHNVMIAYPDVVNVCRSFLKEIGYKGRQSN